MKSIRTLAAMLAVLCLFGSAWAQRPKDKEPPPDYFPLRVADWWSYRSTTADGKQSEFTMKVLSEDKGVFLVEIQSPMWALHESYSKPPGSVMWRREAFPKNNASVAFEPSRQYLKNPLGAGQTWSWKGKGMMGVDVDETSTVAASELVTVPAGKFQAMKVVTKVVQGGALVTKTYWYANWVGLVKSMTESGPVTSTTELMDYSFRRK